MTPQEIALVRSSFSKVQPIAEAAAAMFYDRLFTIDPAIKPLFKGDMAEQGKKLMQTLAVAVAQLDRFDTVAGAVAELGRRHVGYGVADAHYTTVAEALLWTLEKGLGPDFTPETKAAWVKVYTAIAEIMKSASKAA